VQNALPLEQQALGTGALVFFQNFSSAIFITVANAVFQAVLKSEIRANVPEVPVEAAIAAGGSAEAVRQLAPPGPVLDSILLAYSRGFASVMYMLAAIGIVGVVASLGMGWVDLRKTAKAEMEERTHDAKDETKDEMKEETKVA
jgi:H+/gluconate symporter-like permease